MMVVAPRFFFCKQFKKYNILKKGKFSWSVPLCPSLCQTDVINKDNEKERNKFWNQQKFSWSVSLCPIPVWNWCHKQIRWKEKEHILKPTKVQLISFSVSLCEVDVISKYVGKPGRKAPQVLGKPSKEHHRCLVNLRKKHYRPLGLIVNLD